MLKDPLEYSKEELEQLSNEELQELLKVSENKEAFYHTQQMTKKILINSLYGALANKHFPLFNEKIAQAITGNGRFFIQYSALKIEETLQNVLKSEKPYMCYGDTDSVYYQIEPIMNIIIKNNPNKTINDYVDLASKFEEKVVDPVIQSSLKDFGLMFNAYDPSAQGAKREIVSDSACWIAKKKYIARVRDAEGVRYPEDNPHMKVMGLEIARSSTPKWSKEKLEESLNIILDKDETELKTWINQIKPDFIKCNINDIAMNGSVSSLDYKFTDKGIPWMCKAGMYYNKYITEKQITDKYNKINAGEKVKLLCLLSPNPFGTDRIAYTQDKFANELKEYIDYDEQFKLSFLNPLNNMVKALDYDIFNVVGETLDDW